MSSPVFTAPFPPAESIPTSSTIPPLSTIPSSSSPSSSSSFGWSSIFAPFQSVADTLSAARERLNLPDPGRVEDFGKEVKDTHLTQWTFDGARADLAKTFSHDPVFQATHAFAAGSQQEGGISPGSYNFSAAYAVGTKYLLQGNIDGTGSIGGRVKYAWTPSSTTKVQMSLPNSAALQSMLLLEHEHSGRDYCLNVKAINPDPVGSTGTYDLTYLQSVSPSIALGVEAVHSRDIPGSEQTVLGYMAKWHSITRDVAGAAAKDSWIATLQVLPAGRINATYWKKLAERIDGAVEIQMAPSFNTLQRRAVATAGVRYDFRQSTMRAQVDSLGKVSGLLEHRLTPAFSFLVSGELDHKQSTSKFGVGIMLESMDEEVMAHAQAQAEKAQQQQSQF